MGFWKPANVPIPKSISGLILWLDASDSSSMTTSGSEVTQWSDKSSSALAFTQATSANRPVLDTSGTRTALNSINFDNSGGNKFVTSGSSLTIPAAHTIFVVGFWTSGYSGYSSINLQSSTATNCIQGGTCASFYCFHYNSNSGGGTPTTYGMEIKSGSQYSYTVNGVNASTARYLSTMYGDGVAANYTFRNNGSVVGVMYSDLTSSGTINTIGSSDSLYVSNGNIAEVIIYNKKLTAGEITTIENYLKSKWNTP